MSDTNSVVIVSDRQELINQISQKLVLLRNLDKVKTCSIEEATNTLDNLKPNVLIIHCDNNNSQTLNLIKKIKKHDKLRLIPILFLNENCSRETIIEAFDLGISDVIFMPLIDYELLIRVIWCMQKYELNLSIEAKTEFLNVLGVVQAETGVYTQKYCDDFLKNQIAQTKKHAQKACILLIAPDKKYPNYKNPKDFISILKKSIRINDAIIIKDVDEFYIYLQKTKLNGAYSVFERINNNLGVDCGSNAGVVEVQEQDFEDIKQALEDALKKANENTNSLIVACDFHNQTPTSKLDKIKPQMILEKQDTTFKNDMPNQALNEAKTAFDKNSIKLFNQAYARKLKVVVAPVFKKYETTLRLKSQEYAINTYTGTKSLFTISRGDINASMSLEYDGIESVSICLSITDNDQKKLHETQTTDFTILDYRKVSLMLKELIDKFIIIVSKKES